MTVDFDFSCHEWQCRDHFTHGRWELLSEGLSFDMQIPTGNAYGVTIFHDAFVLYVLFGELKLKQGCSTRGGFYL